MVFGDDVAILAETLVFDAGDPAEVFRAMVAFATAGRAPSEHEQIVASLQAGAHDWAVNNFATGCEVADMLVRRLGLGPDVRGALAFTYERWNGNGFPTGAKGDEIPLAMRVVHLSHDMEAIARRVLSPKRHSTPPASAADRTYDPSSPTCSWRMGTSGSTSSPRSSRGTRCSIGNRSRCVPWTVLRSTRPSTVAADFIDLKSPYRAGHSRRCAQLAADAAEVFGIERGRVHGCFDGLR